MHAAFHFGQWEAKSEKPQIPNKTLEQNDFQKIYMFGFHMPETILKIRIFENDF